MVPKVIKTESDYDAALARIEELMGAEPDSPEGDELELLVALVELYEEKNFPIGLPGPVEAIKFRMEQAGLRQRDLVPYIGSRSKVSEVLNGKRSLSLRMIRALHQGLGIPAEVLVQEPGAAIPDEMPGVDWGKFPIKEMIQRKWLSFVGTIAEAKERAEELMRAFFRPLIEEEDFQPVLLRHHVRSGSKMDDYALSAWWAKVLLLARSEGLPPYRQGTITADFMQRLVSLSYLDDGPKLAKEFLSKSGIHFVILRHLPKTHLDGATAVRATGAPVVALTLRYDRLDNFWFCLCHELGHLVLHVEGEDRGGFLDDLDNRGDPLEDQADNFASHALIPPDLWKNSPARRTRHARDVLALAASLRIHPAIVAGRIRRERKNYRILSQLVGRGKARQHFPEEFHTEVEV